MFSTFQICKRSKISRKFSNHWHWFSAGIQVFVVNVRQQSKIYNSLKRVSHSLSDAADYRAYYIIRLRNRIASEATVWFAYARPFSSKRILAPTYLAMCICVSLYQWLAEAINLHIAGRNRACGGRFR